jgi:hypothetical protein
MNNLPYVMTLHRQTACSSRTKGMRLLVARSSILFIYFIYPIYLFTLFTSSPL